jgi:hypothetical protein
MTVRLVRGVARQVGPEWQDQVQADEGEGTAGRGRSERLITS